ncbi:MAG TPA: hypothetical protein DCE23_06510 [Firmicutes bacterium]|nr:hypothetical protein [Bacillota bacterium]
MFYFALNVIDFFPKKYIINNNLMVLFRDLGMILMVQIVFNKHIIMFSEKYVHKDNAPLNLNNYKKRSNCSK